MTMRVVTYIQAHIQRDGGSRLVRAGDLCAVAVVTFASRAVFMLREVDLRLPVSEYESGGCRSRAAGIGRRAR
jgi:hypothetical protein